MRQLVFRRPGRTLVIPIQHLSATDIAAFIDSTLSPEARAAAELHLSGCSKCCEELASCVRLASAAPSRAPARISWPLLGTVAAAIMLVAVLRPRHQPARPDVSRERVSSPVATSLAVVSRPDASFDPHDVRLVWHRDAAAISYHLVVTDSTGAPVWRSDDLIDTSAAVPSNVRLRRGARYFWRVDALHADGSSPQSNTTGFRITR